jgi:hypothetical protein
MHQRTCSTPPANQIQQRMISAKDIAKKAGIKLVQCENGLGLLPFEFCATRSLVAQGKRPGDSGIRASACNGCTHGIRRAASLKGREIGVRFRPGRGVPVKRKSWRPKRKVERSIAVRQCARAGCAETFEVKTVADANRRYHSDECRRIAQSMRPSALKVQVARSKACSTEDCGGVVEIVHGNERYCDTCRAYRGEMQFRRRTVDVHAGAA